MKNHLLMSVLLVFSLLACKETPDDNPPITPPVTPPVTPVMNEDYLPLTKGSWWVYKIQISSTGPVKYDTLRVLPQDTVFDGYTYAIISHKQYKPYIGFLDNGVVEKQLYLKQDSFNVWGYIPYSSQHEYHALRTDLPVDTCWSVHFSYTNTTTTDISACIKQKELTYTIGLHTFDNVIEVSASIINGHPFYYFHDWAYFAGGVGLIHCEREYYYSGTSTYDTYDLVDYYIAP